MNSLKRNMAIAVSGIACAAGGGYLGHNVPKVDSQAELNYLQENLSYAESHQETLTREGVVGGGLVWLLGAAGVAGFRAGRENIAAMER